MKISNLHILFGLILVAFVGSVALIMILPTVISRQNTEKAQSVAATTQKSDTTAPTPLAPQSSAPRPTQVPPAPVTKNIPAAPKSPARYLHTISEIRGRQGQYMSRQMVTQCPDDLTVFKNKFITMFLKIFVYG